MFVLDSSGSIGQQNVEEVVGFLEVLINRLIVDGNDTDPMVSRIGLLTFADPAIIEFKLNTYRKRIELLQAINVRYNGGTTNTSDAIRYSTLLDYFHSNYQTSVILCSWKCSLLFLFLNNSVTD